mgnify:CR=1 FL=1
MSKGKSTLSAAAGRLEQRGQPCFRGLFVQHFPDALPGFRTQMAALFRTGGQIQQSLGQGRDVILRHDDAVAAVLDHFQLAGKIAHHHGHTKSHGFGHRRPGSYGRER